jgi:caspase domain-containing protein
MRSQRVLLASLLGLALSACATAHDPAGGPAPAERPTYAVGDRWIRSDGVYDLVRIEEDRYVFSAGPDREIQLSRDLGLARVVRGQQTLEFSPPARPPWPLELGKVEQGTGSISGSALRRAGRGGTGVGYFGGPVDLTWTVDRYEPVAVPAGTSPAFRISLEVTHRYYRSVVFGLRLWYSPAARQIVKAESRELVPMNFEVVALEREAPAALRVILDTPADRARVAEPNLLLTGRVSSGAGITRVVVTLNAVEVAQIDERAAPKAVVRLNIPIVLRRGQNVLLVTALDAAGETVQEARTVFYDPTTARAEGRGPRDRRLAAAGGAGGAGPGVPTAQAPREDAIAITLAEPRDQARVDQDSIALAGLVQGREGVGRVLVTLNGREVGRVDDPGQPRSVALNLPLALREGRNTIVITATATDGTHHQEVRTVHYERPTPLALSIRYPEDRARLRDEITVLAAVLTSSRGVAHVSVAVNGTEIHQQTERAPQKSLAIAVPVTLRPGPNAIVLTASESDGTKRQDIRTVVYERSRGEEPTTPPAPAARAEPDRWAVVVGAGRYEDPAIPRLRYTVPDAEAVHRFLIGPGGFRPEHVLLLTDRTERKPTLRNLKWALGTFLARSARREDTVLIFFAGHGAPELDPRGIERDGLAKYLVPTDADLDDLYSTALPMDELQTIFNRIEAERIVVLLDACYSGAAGGRTFASRRTRTADVDDVFLERLGRVRGRAIVTAARPSELSLELPDLGHGLFTYYLLEGLSGSADANGDGVVTLQELYEYVERRVALRSQAAGASQHPLLKGELQGGFPLVRIVR